MNLFINDIGIDYYSVHHEYRTVCFLVDKKYLSLFVDVNHMVYQYGGTISESKSYKHWWFIPLNLGYYIYEDVYGKPEYFEIKASFNDKDKRKLDESEIRDLKLNMVLYDC